MTPLDLFDPAPYYDATLLCGRLKGDFIGDRVNGRIFGDTLAGGIHPIEDGMVLITAPVVSYENGILLTEGGHRYRVEIDQ